MITDEFGQTFVLLLFGAALSYGFWRCFFALVA